jgi:neutral ceramidase
MKRASPFLLTILLLIHAPAAQGVPLEAGAAKVDITPPVGYPMWGYAIRRDLPSTGVHDPLHARAVVLAVGPSRLAIISLDLGRPPTRAGVKAIRERASKIAGVESVFLVGSHTHHGPILELDTWPKQGKPYVRQLEDKIVAAIADAAKALRPARLGISTIEVDLNRNRHSKRKDHQPRDKNFTVVRIEDSKGQPIAHLVNFAAHPTMIDARSREISADFPGALSRLVEKEAGGFCLFLQGAQGDLSAKAPMGATGPEQFGEVLGRLVLEQSKKIRCEAADVASLKFRERDFKFNSRVDLGNPLVRAAYSLAFFPAFVSFYEREYREGVRPHLTTAMLDGRIGFVGVSGEFFCEHANHLRRRAGLESLLFFGCCNDYHQYFPTIDAAAAGGYGADATMSPVEIGAGERMMDQALIDLFQLRGKLRK